MSSTKRPRENEDSNEQNFRKKDRKSVMYKKKRKELMRPLIINELSKESLTFQQPKIKPYLPLNNNYYHFLENELICFNIDKSKLSEIDYKFFRYKKEFNNFYELIYILSTEVLGSDKKF